MISHIKDTVPGVAGNCTTAAAFTIAWITTNALPWLHVLSVMVGIGASVATGIYYMRAARTKRARRERVQRYRRRKKRA